MDLLINAPLAVFLLVKNERDFELEWAHYLLSKLQLTEVKR